MAIDPFVCDVVCWISSGVYYRKLKPAICRLEAEYFQHLTAAEVLHFLNIFIGFIGSNLLHFQVFFFFAEQLFLNMFRRISTHAMIFVGYNPYIIFVQNK